MRTIKVSATAARNNFFELLNQIATGTRVIIEKDKKEVAILSPKVNKTDWKALQKASQAIHGIFKNYTPEEISPLRKKGTWKRLGTWDEGLEFSK